LAPDESPHVPVLAGEILRHARVRPGGRVVDATVGAGGHAARLLQAVRPDGLLVGCDRDRAILPFARRRLEAVGGRFHLVWSCLSELPDVLVRFDLRGRCDFVLFDLGVSSLQLDDSRRGFSFDRDGPLDLRMGRGAGDPAHVRLERSGEAELAELFRRYGEEPHAERIARAVVAEREHRPILRTRHLATIVERAVPRRPIRIHPATRVFQALRIAVNRELDELADGIPAALSGLAPGGRFAVLSFHSLEDRIVKRAFRDGVRAGHLQLVVKGAVTPSPEERRRNRRSRSAKLRVVERVS